MSGTIAFFHGLRITTSLFALARTQENIEPFITELFPTVLFAVLA
jgi:hypothetical protein